MKKSWPSEASTSPSRQVEVVLGLIQPLFFLLLFGPLVAANAVSTQESPWVWFVPGILVMTSLFGTAGTGSNLQHDLQGGSHERLLVTPLTRSSLFIGRAGSAPSEPAPASHHRKDH